MVATAIKKGTGIEGLVSECPAVLDHISDIYHSGADLAALSTKFNTYLDDCLNYRFGAPLPELSEVLSPLEIDAFLQSTIRHDSHPEYEFTGPFISKLIQSSFDAGYNDFNLDTRNISSLHRLCSNLKGTYPIRVKVKGNVGDAFGVHSENATFTIDGNAGRGFGIETLNCELTVNDVATDCGREALESTFYIRNTQDGCGHASTKSTFTLADTEEQCGRYSKGSIFDIAGDAGNYLGWKSQGSTFIVRGKTGNHCGLHATGSIFRTPNKITYQRMDNAVCRVRVTEYPALDKPYLEDTGNRVEFIQPPWRERIKSLFWEFK